MNTSQLNIQPRFVFGVDGQLLHGIHIVDEHRILYVAGNNVVVYSTEEQTQYFIRGKYSFYSNLHLSLSLGDNTDTKISCIAVSRSKRYLAICEENSPAVCTVFDVNT